MSLAAHRVSRAAMEALGGSISIPVCNAIEDAVDVELARVRGAVRNAFIRYDERLATIGACGRDEFMALVDEEADLG